ncbi:UNKNOWN [Stylonychia lemnae]|uniref:Cyclin N-terminal domain-containing protein n=1 Tax=Stylonychia lemnae TaxID=5949 RepID=A0A078A1U6_STYLE|nr:UNKNOWN [Stylonychia lemnae]|eukprot:CDW75802.1 UNKNOWN [Stylonychia lemnae]
MFLNNTDHLNKKFNADFENPTIRCLIIPLNERNESTQQQQSGFNLDTTLHLTKIFEDYQQNKGNKIKGYFGQAGSQLSLNFNALGQSTFLENKSKNIRIQHQGIQQKLLVTEKKYFKQQVDEVRNYLPKSPEIQKFSMSWDSYDLIKKCQIELQYKSQKEDSKIQTVTKIKPTECIFEQQITNQDRQGELYQQFKVDREDKNVLFGQQNSLMVLAFEFHEISLHHRQNMVNWMLQVFRVLKVVTPKTFMLSVQIMDKYFKRNYELSNKISKEDLHLVDRLKVQFFRHRIKLCLISSESH